MILASCSGSPSRTCICIHFGSACVSSAAFVEVPLRRRRRGRGAGQQAATPAAVSDQQQATCQALPSVTYRRVERDGWEGRYGRVPAGWHKSGLEANSGGGGGGPAGGVLGPSARLPASQPAF